jgi:predicted dehydrogenase
MAYKLSECREIVETCCSRGVTLSVNHERRLGEPFAWARLAISEGRIGKVRNVQITTNVDWWHSIYDDGSHTIDGVRFMLGDPRAKEIFAQVEVSGAKRYRDGHVVEERTLATVLLDNAVRLVYDCSDRVRTEEAHIQIAGSEGLIELFLEPPPGSPGVIRCVSAGAPRPFCPELKEDFWGNIPAFGGSIANLAPALADLITAHETGSEPALSGRNTYYDMEIVVGILISAHKGRTIQAPFDALDEADKDVLALFEKRPNG